jgi:hypothetical protein
MPSGEILWHCYGCFASRLQVLVIKLNYYWRDNRKKSLYEIDFLHGPVLMTEQKYEILQHAGF